MAQEQSLYDLLLLDTSRRTTDLIIDLVSQSNALLNNLIDIYFQNEEPVSRRAAWAIDILSESRDILNENHYSKMVQMLHSFHHDGLKRHTLRMLSRAPLPTGDQMGMLLSVCFDWLTKQTESVAVKVHCMEILYRISQGEPDLKQELADTIEWRMEEELPGFRNKGNKLLAKLRRELSSVN